MISRKNRTRKASILTTSGLMLFVLCFFTDGIRAEQRKFVVMMAQSPKAFADANGEPVEFPGGLPNVGIIREDYFDGGPGNSDDPAIDSFAEYWEEISYGDVTVSGEAFLWIALPWVFNPAAPNAPLRNSPADYIDLFGFDSGRCTNTHADLPRLFQYGAGEVFCDCATNGDILPDISRDKCGALIIIDLIGDPPILEDPERGLGLVDSIAVGINVWTPGERFVDVDGDDRWDGIDEKNDMMCHGVDGCRGICSAMICEPVCVGGLKDGQPCHPANGNVDCEPGGVCHSQYCTTEADCLPGVGCERGSLSHCEESGTICSVTNPCSDGSRCVLANMPCPEPTCVGGPNDGDFCNPDHGHDDCLPSGICDSDVVDTCTGGETCGDARGSGPRGCDSPGCGDLFMPCINFDAFENDNDCGNPGGNNLLTESGCTPPNFIPCATDEDCPGSEAGRCRLIDSFGDQVGLCDPGIAIPCTDDAQCANQACDTVARFCAPESLCFVPKENVDINLPECCAEELETDPLATCADGGGVILCSRYPNDGRCNPLPEGIVCGSPRLCCEFDDVDESRSVNVAEPFEDFLIRWNPLGFSPGRVWVPVDRKYIKDNYPGDVPALLARTGNGYYDSPDMFFDHLDEFNNPEGTKMMQDAGVNAFTWRIPKPGSKFSYVSKADEPTWFDDWWTTRYGSTPPIWPGGNSPASENGVRMRAFDPAAPNPPVVNSVTDRRWFQSNRGGWNGFGRGTQDDRLLRFDLGGNEWEDDILPEEEFGYYDGWVEHDDLASSRYHKAGDKRLGEITSPTTDTVLGGYTAIFGADLGPHDPEQLSPTGDGWGVAAGPGAINIHGEKGYDAGDVCLVEWLTWRTDGSSLTNTRMWELENGTYHPFATPATFSNNYRPTGLCSASTRVACRADSDCPGSELCVRPTNGIGFRDYNLDGMIDQGEVRPELSENYSVDSNPDSGNDGEDSDYPFNRSRLTEDVVEALDPSVDWADWSSTNFVGNGRCCEPSTDPCATDSDCFSNGVCRFGRCCYPSDNGCGHCEGTEVCFGADRLVSGIVIVPSGSYNDTGLFPLAPSLNWPIQTQDNPFLPFFSDLVICTDCADAPSAIAYAAHEYLHSWEGYPDLYDYDKFDGPSADVNCPIGRWDIMADGGLVHPVPPLKENKSGWIESINLKTVLTPGVETTLDLRPAELTRDNSYYYLENDVADSSGELLGERYYFWAAGRGFDVRMPGSGMLILKTKDFRADSDALALQQRTDPFNFRIVQADGQSHLESCSSDDGNDGDAGDNWPGTSNATKFSFETNPPAIWDGGRWSGLDVTNVEPQPDGSVLLTLKWEPTNIPSLKFIDPPGGGTVGSKYRIRYETTDVYGRTDITLYYTQNNDGIPDPSAATQIVTRRKGDPGTVGFIHNWDTSGLPDGLYYLFAKLTPDTSVPPPPSNDGPEIRHTDPLPKRNNQGDGEIQNILLGSESRLETWVVEFVDPTNQEWVVSSSLTQPLPEEGEPGLGFKATTGVPYASKDDVLHFKIVSGAIPFELGDTFTFKTTGITKFTASLRVEDGMVLTGPQPVIVATVEGAAPGAPLSGNVPLIVNFDTQGSMDPEGLPLTYAWDFGDGSVGAGSQVSHTYNESGVFTVTLRATNTVPQTGVATVDVTVINNSPSAVISADPTSGPAPLDVDFDAAGSSDPETQNPGDLAYQWDFGDGTTANSQNTPGLQFQSIEDHRYQFDEFGTECTSASTCLFIATLTVTDPGGASSTASIQISVGNSSPVANITVSPTSGDSPLTVTFDATGSTDVDGDDIEIIWDFGDGEVSPRIPVGTVTHDYETGTYLATATLFDARNGLDRGGVTEWPGQSITVRTPVPPSSIPIARFDFDPAPPFTVGQEFKVVSTSVDRPNEATQLTHKWNFGDGTDVVEGLDKQVTHTYSTGNETGFTVTLIVTDDEGNTAQVSKLAEVTDDTVGGPGGEEDENKPPTAVFVINTNGDPVVEDQLVQFDASGSMDPEGGVLQYRWDFGDGSRAEAGFGSDYVLRTHTYTDPGVYTVLLTVSDEFNASADAMDQITVLSSTAGNRPPVAILVDGPRVGAAPFTVRLDGRLSYDPDNDPLRFIWEFSDENGVIETIAGDGLITKTFDTVGTYTVVMKVDDGKVADDELPFVTDEIRVTSPVVLPDPIGPGQDVPDDGPPAGSQDQRPASVLCGFGMLSGIFVSLLGLSVMRLHRRRRGFLRS